MSQVLGPFGVTPPERAFGANPYSRSIIPITGQRIGGKKYRTKTNKTRKSKKM